MAKDSLGTCSLCICWLMTTTSVILPQFEYFSSPNLKFVLENFLFFFVLFVFFTNTLNASLSVSLLNSFVEILSSLSSPELGIFS
jgi:hypothetical protein